MSQTKAQLIDGKSAEIEFTGGTASAPAISFTGDANTGIYSPGADQVAISTNGTGRLFVDASGNVGVGAASPANNLHVASATNSVVKIEGTGGYAQIILDGNGAGNNFLVSDDPLAIYTNGAERARIDSSGRLLVGTSSSRGVGGNIQAKLQIEGTGTGGNTTACSVSQNSNDATGPRFMLAKSRSTSIGGVTIVQANDSLGIIDFAGADGTDAGSSAVRISAEVDGTPGANDMPGRLVFSTTADGASSPTERMRITSRGFLKVSNTGSYLDPSGFYHEINSDRNNSSVLRVKHTGASGQQYGIGVTTANDQNDATRYFLKCSGASTERATIRSNGGLANYSANNANLSDINAKKDISPAPGTWNCLKQWEIVNYRYKDQSDDAGLNLGVIAQQVAESCPEVITVFQEAKEATEDQPAQEERLGVKEQQMYWMAIKALQEAQLRIEALEAEVAALKAQ